MITAVAQISGDPRHFTERPSVEGGNAPGGENCPHSTLLSVAFEVWLHPKSNHIMEVMKMNTAPIQGDKLLRLTEASVQLNVSYWALRDWCRSGKVSHHRIGKFLMVSQSEVFRIIQESLVQQ
jgi:hypothetical protein